MSETVNDLISLAENAGGHDNISVDLIEILKSTHKKSVFSNKGGKSIEMTATQVVDPSKFKKKSSLKIVFAMIIFLLTAGGAGYFAYNRISSFTKKNENVSVTKKIDTDEQKIKEEEAKKIAEEQKIKEEEAKKEQARKLKELEDEKDEEKRKKLERELREAEEKIKIAEEGKNKS